MKDFFVSYTGSDTAYATWVAELLERNGYTVTIQAWDFRPGDNFVKKIDDSLYECHKLIIILSNNYLKSEWCKAEWTTKLAEQVEMKETRVIPIRIEPVNLNGLLSPIVYIDLVDKSEKDAEQLVLNGIQQNTNRISDGYPAFYNLEHHEIDIDYYVNESNITYIKGCKSRVMIGGKNKIHNRITWFPDEKIELYSLSKDVEIEYLDLRDTNLNYNVVFNHLLEKSEEIEFRIKAILSNSNHHFANFFSSEIIVPVELLSVHLNLTDESVSKVYTQKLSSSPMNIRTEQPVEHIFRSPFHWHVPNPEVNFEYKIYW